MLVDKATSNIALSTRGLTRSNIIFGEVNYQQQRGSTTFSFWTRLGSGVHEANEANEGLDSESKGRAVRGTLFYYVD